MVESEEVAPGVVLDYIEANQVVGIEMLKLFTFWHARRHQNRNPPRVRPAVLRLPQSPTIWFRRLRLPAATSGMHPFSSLAAQ
ncbi:MAG: DUF2283 domain-containing protein [Caldilineaceae bacterium]|nr:DUF2283 domain-containing protein [Caldilineaceae bacterium]MCY4092032.1 DUF2283 domain-containing protein [Caldilineaceae bacterium]MCY4116599.1 DUF2283 domain-containing protein [Caldilineaceae bacterium]MDE0069085.1 DUF2283 domain-containing protein [Caldilineaceae bacterium]MDE0183680.1 DUF2283 domain-containing protein [Caldilineaceae bacterium]